MIYSMVFKGTLEAPSVTEKVTAFLQKLPDTVEIVENQYHPIQVTVAAPNGQANLLIIDTVYLVYVDTR